MVVFPNSELMLIYTVIMLRNKISIAETLCPCAVQFYGNDFVANALLEMWLGQL
jgi:hypothetical protein